MTTKVEEVKAGDWVRFYQDGKLVIGVVQYSPDEQYYAEYRDIITDIGKVNERDVLECRRKSIDVSC